MAKPEIDGNVLTLLKKGNTIGWILEQDMETIEKEAWKVRFGSTNTTIDELAELAHSKAGISIEKRHLLPWFVDDQHSLEDLLLAFETIKNLRAENIDKKSANFLWSEVAATHAFFLSHGLNTFSLLSVETNLRTLRALLTSYKSEPMHNILEVLPVFGPDSISSHSFVGFCQETPLANLVGFVKKYGVSNIDFVNRAFTEASPDEAQNILDCCSFNILFDDQRLNNYCKLRNAGATHIEARVLSLYDCSFLSDGRKIANQVHAIAIMPEIPRRMLARILFAP